MAVSSPCRQGAEVSRKQKTCRLRHINRRRVHSAITFSQVEAVSGGGQVISNPTKCYP